MRLINKSIVAHIWVIAIIFYLFRSIAEPLKYLFIISFSILIICYFYFLIKDFKDNRILKYLFVTKEFQILGLFLILGIFLSNPFQILSIKSLINFFGATIFYLVYFEYRNHIQLSKLYRGWIFLTILIGTLGLLKWLNLILEFNLDFFSVFYTYGSSLVSEYNFYACHFIISLAIYFYAIHKRIVQTKLITNQLILFLFLSNIVLAGSRRGLIVLTLFLLVSIFLLVGKRKERQHICYKNLSYFIILISIFFIISISLFPFRSRLINEKSTKIKIAVTVYRYSTILNPSITYGILYDMLWPKYAAYESAQPEWETYATYNNLVDGNINNKYRDLVQESWLQLGKKPNVNNLFYNGDFVHGQSYWKNSTPDSIKNEIIDTKYGNALRVSRFNGSGYWPLSYRGREIIYYKGVTYTFKFKFRVIKGSSVPFMIGWWFNEGDGFKNNLPYNIRKLDNEWFEYTASYKFISNQHNLTTFMNSQQANTVIDFADVELTCDDIQNRPMYVDQLMHIEGHNLFFNSNFENGLEFWGSRTPDSINHELIKTQYGNAIRVTRKDGDGYWPLAYLGRDIYYYKDLTYYFRFKFRVIEGGKTPFNIGWWAEDKGENLHNLEKYIITLNDEWFECRTSYTFKKDFYGDITTFMNSQKANTIIDFADIELICNDTLNRSMFADEKLDLISALEESRIREQLESEDKELLSERTARWKYAKELWTNEYNWSNKLLGKGFDYLEKFGQKFYPDEDRIDYPHNPIISSFLYSGIIGGFFYIYFLALSFWYYWKYRRHHMLFFILFLITFVFIFISSDSHFNVPIFAMLSLVPFITKYIVKEKEQKNPA